MRACFVVALLALTVLLAGCGDGRDEATAQAEAPLEDRYLAVTLAGWEDPQSAGLLMAEKRGYFADLGIDIAILSPATPARPIQYVVDGTDDLGVSYLPQVVLAKERGVPIVAVGSLIRRPSAAMIWLRKSKIRGIGDLKGKTIAIPGLRFQQGFLQVVLARAGLTLEDVEVRNIGYELVSELVHGRADAIFGGAWNIEGAELEDRGLEPVITRVADLGFPAYDELVVIARSDRVAEEPQLIRDFVSAFVRGTAAAIENPEGAAAAVEAGAESEPFSSWKGTLAEVEATLPLLSRTGYISLTQASFLIDWMHREGLIRQKLPASAVITNEFVP